ncbi:DNA glycosylase [Aureobasidium sp. EXF-12298]|nr:DNA glycosylase [Aureobasidium sp. EXF-12298]KAI4760404.1 DNA glycosylase [Aureobasidium sp. EXF-12344]KAI4772385.1 DNA glycosylase [Aureobasidium sp. EXF-3400]
MRTSKVSRETARVVDALSSRGSNGNAPRRSLRNFAHTADVNYALDDASSDLSSLASSASPSSASPSPPPSGRKRKRTLKTEVLSPNASAANRNTNLPKKTKRQPAKRIKGEHGPVEPPPNWEKVYSITAEMRKKVLAPVDTMGCESLAERNRSPIDRRLQTLIALMLSSQTKDTVTAVAMKTLQDNLEGGFNLAALLTVEPERLNELIAKVGFHNNKTKYIKATAEILRDRFDGDIPDTIEGLVSLPGVGPKMAYLTMSAAWGRDEGIGVDVHVHRITNLWGWHKTRNPEETRAELESWLPKEKWHDINHLLVGFGQTICLPVGRKCNDCVLATEGLCPSAVVKKEVTKRVKKVKDEGEVKTEVDAVVKEEKADEDAPPLDVPLAGAGTIPDIEGTGAGIKEEES